MTMKAKPTYEELERRIQKLEKILSEYKSSREALRESENLFKLLYEKTPLGYQSLDEKGHLIVVNKTWLDILGYAKEEVIGKSFADFLHPDWRDDFNKNFPRFKSIGEVLGVEFELVKKNGDLILVSFTGRIGRDEKGNFQQTHCIFHDITKRKLAEKAQQESNERLTTVLDSIDAHVYIADMETYEVLFSNLYGRKVWGDSRGKKCWSVFQKNQDGPCAFCTNEKLLDKDGKPTGVHVWEFQNSVNGKCYDCRDVAISWTDGRMVRMEIATDITERKRVDAKILYLQKSESLGRMASAIAHHFNNQLTVVMGNLELVLGDLPDDAENRKNLLQSMMAAKKAAEVSRQMLSYLGQTSGKHEPINLSEVCRQSLSLLRAAIPKGVILKADFSSSDPVILADAGEIQQALAILITNAWESFPSHQGSIGLTIRTVTYGDIPLSRRNPFDWQPQHIPHVCLEVSDTGSGISNKDIGKLFDPFFTTKFTGRGMGLSVAMGIVKSHGGCLTLDSEPGSGSVFRVFLPVSTETIPLPIMPEKSAAAPVKKVENGGTVLLIEDDEMLRNLAKAMLTHIGYNVIEAQDGVEAVQIFQLQQDKIVCALADLTMPRMNGWETLTELRRMRPNVPVILASGYDEESVMAGDHLEQPQVFLNKPYMMAALKDALARALEGKLHLTPKRDTRDSTCLLL